MKFQEPDKLFMANKCCESDFNFFDKHVKIEEVDVGLINCCIGIKSTNQWILL